VVNITITITSDAPVVNANNGPLSYTENQAATAIDTALWVARPPWWPSIWTVELSARFLIYHLLAADPSHPRSHEVLRRISVRNSLSSRRSIASLITRANRIRRARICI